MLAVGAVGVATVGAAVSYVRRGRADDVSDAASEEAEIVEKEDVAPQPEPKPTWKESAGRADGRDGYVFGDITRGVAVRWSGGKSKQQQLADETVEAEGDSQHTQVQRLVREAVRLYRARGYKGTINMSHSVAYFCESVNVSVDGTKNGKAPWQVEEGAAAAAPAAEAAPAVVVDGASAESLDAETKMAKEGQAGLVFATLLARLERRAASWQALAGMEGLDPNLTASAQIGFAIPVVKLGWGVSVSLTVSASSLLRWAAYAAGTSSPVGALPALPMTEAELAEEQAASELAAELAADAAAF